MYCVVGLDDGREILVFLSGLMVDMAERPQKQLTAVP